MTKPIDPTELKERVCRTLRLETAYKYFQQRNGVMALMLPNEFHSGVANDVSANLDNKLAETVDAGGNKLIIELNSVEVASLPIIKLVISAMEAATRLSLRHAVVCSEEIKVQCRKFEDSQSWVFASSFEQALALLK